MKEPKQKDKPANSRRMPNLPANNGSQIIKDEPTNSRQDAGNMPANKNKAPDLLESDNLGQEP
jgi:hypothetical protein